MKTPKTTCTRETQKAYTARTGKGKQKRLQAKGGQRGTSDSAERVWGVRPKDNISPCPVGHLLYERRQFRKASSFRGGGTQCGRSQKSPGRTMFAPTVCLSSRYKCNHTNKKSGQFCAVRFLFKKSLDFRFRLFRCIRRHNVPDFEPEGRAFAQLAVYAVVVVVHLQNLFDDGQPQSRSHHFTLVVL